MPRKYQLNNQNNTFHGYFLDTGATRGVVGTPQYEAYTKHINELAILKTSHNTFSFGT